jgi:hypothetical protein
MAKLVNRFAILRVFCTVSRMFDTKTRRIGSFDGVPAGGQDE